MPPSRPPIAATETISQPQAGELAQRSAKAARETKALITNSGDQVRQGVALVGRTGSSLEAIATCVKDVDAHIASIVKSACEEASALQEINVAVTVFDQDTQQNAAMVEESTAATHALAQQVEAIANALAAFTVSRPESRSGAVASNHS